MIPEYLFKQAEREANAAMMKELYAEGGMDPAVAGMDPEEVDPEVAAAINAILMQLGNSQEEVPEESSGGFETGEADENDESDDNHTVEKASALLPLFQKVADFDPNKDYGHLKADDMQVPETTWFENLANSAPISKALDLAEATGVDRWADNNFMGDIGTGLGNLINSYDSNLTDAAAREAEMGSRVNARRQEGTTEDIETIENNKKYQDLKNSISGYTNTLKNWGNILRSTYESAGRGASIENIDGYADYKNMSPQEIVKVEDWLRKVYWPMTQPGEGADGSVKDYAIPKGLHGLPVNIPEYMMHAAANIGGGLPAGILSGDLTDIKGYENQTRNPIAELSTPVQQMLNTEDDSDLNDEMEEAFVKLLKNKQALPYLNFGDNAGTVSSRLRMDNIGPRMVGMKQKRWDK